MMRSVERTEIAVVGAGPSGAATALLLARAGHAVTVFDRARFPRDKACGEGLMPPGVHVLRDLETIIAHGELLLRWPIPDNPRTIRISPNGLADMT